MYTEEEDIGEYSDFDFIEKVTFIIYYQNSSKIARTIF